jgi:hypothetical protein
MRAYLPEYVVNHESRRGSAATAEPAMIETAAKPRHLFTMALIEQCGEREDTSLAAFFSRFCG